MATSASTATKPRYDEEGLVCFDMGEHTLKVPMSLHSENRDKLRKRLIAKGVPEKSVVILQGGDDINRYCTDVQYVFLQEAYFHWMFGVLEPGWFGAMDVSTGRTILFCPRLPQDYAKWMGRIIPPEEFKTRYQVDEVRFVEEISDVLRGLEVGTLLTLRGVDTDSDLVSMEAAFDGISNFNVNNELLFPEIAECRVTKSKKELDVMRFTCSVGSAAHCAVMRKIRPGMKEYQVEAIFQHHTYYYGGCRHQGYTNICGSGVNAAVLHYGHAGAPNSRTIQDGDMCLFDMGAEYYRYTSDITCSFPSNGKFTADQKMIYNAVLAARDAVMAACKPGVNWVDMHELSYRTMLTALRDGGLLKGNVDDMMKVNLGAVFQPHGLGHLLGLNAHDVGGYLPHCPSRPTPSGFCNLRFARNLEENMVITIEPGCYFIDYLLEGALSNPEQAVFFVPDVLERFRNFGGVRIEDDVVITANGVEDLTRVPRTVEAIEALMAEGLENEKVDIPQLSTQNSCS